MQSSMAFSKQRMDDISLVAALVVVVLFLSSAMVSDDKVLAVINGI